MGTHCPLHILAVVVHRKLVFRLVVQLHVNLVALMLPIKPNLDVNRRREPE